MIGKMIGFKKFSSKVGKACVIASVVVPFTDRESQSGAVGMNTMNVFVADGFHDVVNAGNLDKDFNIEGAWANNSFYNTRFEPIK